MKKEDQVCTLEQAKKLFDLGVEQNNNQDRWLAYVRNGEKHYRLNYTPALSSIEEEYSAFNVAELGHIFSNLRYESLGFPMVFTSYSQNDDLTAKIMGKWSVMFRNPVSFSNPEIKCDTEAQARAEMLIWLLENTGLTVEMVNKAINS